MYTVDEILKIAKKSDLPLPKWKWKRLQPYKGFSHEERVKGWQASKLAVQMKLIPDANELKCEICEAKYPVKLSYHSENYLKLAHHVVCKSCHFKIHQGLVSL